MTDYAHNADPRIFERLGEIPRNLFSDAFVQSNELLERYGLQWAIDLADELGIAAALGDGSTASAACQSLGFVPEVTPAIAWILKVLVSEGLAERLNEDEAGLEWTVRMLGPLRPIADRTQLRKQALATDPANQSTLDLLDAAAAAYPRVARGEVTGEAVLLGPAGAGLWGNYFHNDNPVYSITNKMTALAVANRLPEKGLAHVIEVGAGAGSASEALLAELGERGLLDRLAGYQITEVSPFFRRRAERSLPRTYPELPLTFLGLDIDLSWSEQGAVPGSADMVFGVNVFHVAKDLGQCLQEVRETLRPGGWLVAGECLRTRPEQPVSVELVFQLLTGFTQVATDPVTRPTHGFLTPGQWTTALEAAGFDEVVSVPDVEEIGKIYPYFLAGAICARRPS